MVVVGGGGDVLVMFFWWCSGGKGFLPLESIPQQTITDLRITNPARTGPIRGVMLQKVRHGFN